MLYFFVLCQQKVGLEPSLARLEKARARAEPRPARTSRARTVWLDYVLLIGIFHFPSKKSNYCRKSDFAKSAFLGRLGLLEAFLLFTPKNCHFFEPKFACRAGSNSTRARKSWLELGSSRFFSARASPTSFPRLELDSTQKKWTQPTSTISPF